MYTLYYSPGAASFAVHWALIELGVPFETRAVDLDAKAQKSAEYLKLNPGGVVPTLLIDGQPHAETAALLLLLAERHKALSPEPGAPSRADYLQWMVYLANTLQPSFRLWFYAEEGAGPENAEATRVQARSRIEAVWARLDERLGGRRRFIIGDGLTMVDIYATMLARWSRNMPKPAQAWPNIATYLKQMKTHPSLREVHKREGMTEWIDQ